MNTSDVELAVIKTIQRLISQVELMSIDEQKRLHTAITNFAILLQRHIDKDQDDTE